MTGSQRPADPPSRRAVAASRAATGPRRHDGAALSPGPAGRGGDATLVQPTARPEPRGACPSLVAPMPTGDGLIARLLPADGALSTAALLALCDAARACGNGLVEVTQRGSLQLRGVRAETVEALEAAVSAAGATPPPGPPVHVGPLAGLDPAATADPRPLAAALRARLANAAALPPKLAIVVDGGGRWPLDGLSADLRLTAVAAADTVRWRLDSDFEVITPPLPEAAAIDAAVAAVSAIARSERRRPTARVAHPPVGLLLPPAGAAGRSPSQGADGPDIAATVTAAGTALPFGIADAADLAALAAAARTAGAGGVRLTPGHGLVFLGGNFGEQSEAAMLAGRSRFDAAGFLAAADRLGFITRPDDPRLAVSVCAGAPACASGEAPTRPLAGTVVAAAAPLIAAGGEVHLSGCPKGCARAAPAALTIVARAGGYGMVEDATARDMAGEIVSAAELLAAVAAASQRLAADSRTRDSGAAPGDDVEA